MTERLQTVLLVTGLGGLVAAVGWLMAGGIGLAITLGGAALTWHLAPQVPNAWVLKAVKARRLTRFDAPPLFALRDRIVARAGLRHAPDLYIFGSDKPQAFTIGEPHDAAIVLSSSLTRALAPRELAGVLAHEITHVAHGDVRLLRFANTFLHVAASLSRAATLVALVLFPLIITGMVDFAPGPFLAVVVAPWIAQAFLLALSRTREFAADAGAATLTQDPEGLARALARLESHGQSVWHRMLGLAPRSLPAWLQTHPPTEDRIRRLMADATSRKAQGAVPRQRRSTDGRYVIQLFLQ